MSALVFPPNPTTGQEFTGPFGEIYTWDSEKWTLTADGGGGGGPAVIISDTAPLNPVDGTLWWDTDSAKLFLWDGEQWVITVSSVGDTSAIAYNWTGAALDAYVNNTYVGTVPLGASDPRLKTNVAAPTIDALDVISQITLQQFDLRGLGPNAPDQHWDIGFMADQLLQLIPISVNPGDGKKTYDSVSPLPILAYVIGAMQQLSARVVALEGAR